MSDLEINKALALAIGYEKHEIFVEKFGLVVKWRHLWLAFNYRDWNVIGPIAAKYDCFPMKSTEKPEEWFTYAPGDAMNAVYADTPQKAIALAVIGANT